ncbi:hypothetical protein AB4097_12145 [Microvirga sp. 2MCAF35]|uniref:hypothetical protein n=1 Tax=Microvirga sp. 2MCAF35 TaxID=3232987 RepID=UPI003F9B5C17
MKLMVAPAKWGDQLGWRVNVAGCPATSEDYRMSCDRPMTMGQELPAPSASHAEVVGNLNRAKAEMCQCSADGMLVSDRDDTLDVITGLVPVIPIE